MPYTVTPRTARIRDYCNHYRWSVDQFSDKAEISRSTTYRVLGGRTNPSAAFIAACAVLFGEDALPDLFHFGHSSEGKIPTEPPPPPFAPRLHARGAFDEKGAA